MKIHDIALNKAISILNSLGCQFAIIDSDGNQHGDLVIATERQRSSSQYPRGEPTKFVSGYLSTIKTGQVVEIPFEKYGGMKLQSWVSSYMYRTFGRDSYTSHINENTGFLEVLKIT